MVMNHYDSAFNRHPNPARGCAESVNWNLKGAENPKTFGPKSHGGLSSEGRLNSWSNSAPQRTGPTPHCPALGDFPDRLATVKALAQLGATLGREFYYAL